MALALADRTAGPEHAAVRVRHLAGRAELAVMPEVGSVMAEARMPMPAVADVAVMAMAVVAEVAVMAVVAEVTMVAVVTMVAMLAEIAVMAVMPVTLGGGGSGQRDDGSGGSESDL
jgi:hypothetical protein